MRAESTINYSPFSLKHKIYINRSLDCKMNVAEGAIRSGKTIDHCIIAAMYLEECEDKVHLASGSSGPNAKLNIGYCNGFGLECIFRGRCRWGKFKDNEALFIQTKTGEKVVIFVGGGKSDSFKKILGNSYGLWIATEINEHYDCDDSRTSFIKVALGRQIASKNPKILWDLNPCNPNDKIYQRYIDKYMGGSQIKNYCGDEYFAGGYQYNLFTINDNLSITDERKKEIYSTYTVGSVWYRRDILGERAVAEGLIYQPIADNKEEFLIDKEMLKDLIKRQTKYIDVGVDFGGNGSYHAITATMRVQNLLIVLKSKKYKSLGTDSKDVVKYVKNFCDYIVKEWGFIDMIYCDHINVIVNSINNETNYSADLTEKPKINERIFIECKLIGEKRLYFVKDECDDLLDGMSEAVYDEKAAQMGEDVRKDTDATENDCIDSFEYSWVRYIDDYA